MSLPKAFVSRSPASRLSRSTVMYSSVVSSAVVTLCSVVGCGSSRTSTTQTSPAQEAPLSDNRDTTEASCPEEVQAGFESPDIAFRRYAEDINTRNWCGAAGTFERSARVDLAEINFKALALLAGAPNPNRGQYHSQLELFCGKHALGCQDPRWAEQAAADLMTGTDVAPKLVELRKLAADRPAQIYRELMLHMGAVDAGALTRFDTSLESAQVTDGQAAGTARQEDGRTSRINFVKTTTGWLLVVR